MLRFGYSSLTGKGFLEQCCLIHTLCWITMGHCPTLSWQEFAECEAPGLTWVKVQQGKSKDTQGIHGLVVLQEIQDPIWTNTREMFI